MTTRQISDGDKAAEKAKRSKQKLCLELMDEIDACDRKKLDLSRRLREIFTTGTTGTEPLWQDFKRLWEQKTGDVYDAPIPASKATIRRLLKTLSSEDLRFRMVRYFEGDDDFRRRNSYSITLFGSQIHTLGQAHSAAPMSDEQLARARSRRLGLFGGDE